MGALLTHDHTTVDHPGLNDVAAVPRDLVGGVRVGRLVPHAGSVYSTDQRPLVRSVRVTQMGLEITVSKIT